MFDIDKWQEIYQTIKKHKLRTLLTAFGVFWGIFMLVLLLGAGKGLQNGVEYEFRDDAVNSIWIWRGRTSIDHKGLPKGRSIKLTNNEHEAIATKIKGIEYFSSRLAISGEFTVKYKNKNTSFTVRCVHPDYKYLENTEVKTGRFINETDIKEKRKVAAIGKKVVESFFSDIDPIGEMINIKGIEFLIVGTFDDSGSTFETNMIYIPISTAQQVFSYGNEVYNMMFTTGNASLEETNQMAKDVKQLLADRLNFSSEDKQAVYIRNNAEEFAKIQGLFTGIRGFVWFVGLGTILAGIIGVSNIMLIIVKERTKEIGIRKALGATPWSIVSMIITESIVITSFAGYFGLLTGVALIEAIRSAIEGMDLGFFKNPEIDFFVAVSATIVLVVSGAIAGLVPAIKAAKVPPIEALRAD